MRKTAKPGSHRSKRTQSGRILLPRSKSDYSSMLGIANGEKVDADVLSKGTNGDSTVTPSLTTKAPLEEYVTADMYKWYKLFMVLQDGCLSCYRSIAESVLEIEQVSAIWNEGDDSKYLWVHVAYLIDFTIVFFPRGLSFYFPG